MTLSPQSWEVRTPSSSQGAACPWPPGRLGYGLSRLRQAALVGRGEDLGFKKDRSSLLHSLVSGIISEGQVTRVQGHFSLKNEPCRELAFYSGGGPCQALLHRAPPITWPHLLAYIDSSWVRAVLPKPSMPATGSSCHSALCTAAFHLNKECVFVLLILGRINKQHLKAVRRFTLLK